MPLPPKNPHGFDKVNYVIDAWTTGCDAPWYIYVETMKPAALKAFITLITFGWDDVLRGYFRPKGLYHRRTGKRKGKWTRRIPRFPELGNTLGKQLPGAAEARGTKWNNLGKTLWRIDGAMEQIRFYWLVASIVEDFAFDWTSLLYESYWCQEDPPGGFSVRANGPFALPGGAWRTPSLGTVDWEHGSPVWFLASGQTGANPATITAAAMVSKHPSYPPPTSFAVKIETVPDGLIISESTNNDLDANGEGSVPVSGLVPPGTEFRVRCKPEGTAVALYSDIVCVGIEQTQ